MTDDLEALFDKISDEQRAEDSATTSAPPSSEPEASEDDLEALFDEVSAQNDSGTIMSASTDESVIVVPEQEAEPSDTDLEALFDELSSEVSAHVEISADVLADDSHKQIDPDPVNTADKPLYDRVGGILRQLHDSMRELGYDRALQDVATEVIDAKGRLEYVATLTEQAATRVLNSIDIGMPQQEELSKTARNLEQKWSTLFDGNMDIDEFKQLAQDSREFAVNTANRADEEKARLMEIMMAQDFQDITGQVIKKVIVITKKLEQELAQLLRDNAPPESKEKVVDLMSGPDVPEKAMAQDDVDGLLANLGF